MSIKGGDIFREVYTEIGEVIIECNLIETVEGNIYFGSERKVSYEDS
jgi:hypothetical protein